MLWIAVAFTPMFLQLPILEAGIEVSGGQNEPGRLPQLPQCVHPLRRDLSPLQRPQHTFPAGAKLVIEKRSSL